MILCFQRCLDFVDQIVQVVKRSGKEGCRAVRSFVRAIAYDVRVNWRHGQRQIKQYVLLSQRIYSTDSEGAEKSAPDSSGVYPASRLKTPSFP